MCSLRRLSRIVRLEGAALPWGMLLFSKSLRTIWFISSEGLIQQLSLAKALTVIAFTNASCFLIVRHRFCRKGPDFRVLTPIYFPPQTILPTWHAQPYLTHFLENGWVRIGSQRPSLELPARGYGEMEFSLLLPNIGQNVHYASIQEVASHHIILTYTFAVVACQPPVIMIVMRLSSLSILSKPHMSQLQWEFVNDARTELLVDGVAYEKGYGLPGNVGRGEMNNCLIDSLRQCLGDIQCGRNAVRRDLKLSLPAIQKLSPI